MPKVDLTIPCSICGKGIGPFDRARFMVAAPEGKTLEECPPSMAAAHALGYTIEVVCPECDDG
jgi:hypothetical protein